MRRLCPEFHGDTSILKMLLSWYAFGLILLFGDASIWILCRHFCLEYASIEFHSETLLSSFILRRFYWVSFWDASIEFHSETLLARFFYLEMLLSEFYVDAFVLNMLLSDLLEDASVLNSFFFSFSLGSRRVPVFMWRVLHMHWRMPVVMWRAPLCFQLHILGSFQILHSCPFIFFGFSPFLEHF